MITLAEDNLDNAFGEEREPRSNVFTLSEMISVFGLKDPAPIRVVRTDKHVQAERGDTRVTVPAMSLELAPRPGLFSLTLTPNGGFVLIEIKPD